jgi:hypothetical protein
MRTSGPEAKAALAKHPELGTDNLWQPVRIKLFDSFTRGWRMPVYEIGDEIRATAAEAALLIEADRAVLA